MVLQDLRAVECDMLTLGQYLLPSLHHTPVARYVTQDEFFLAAAELWTSVSGAWRAGALVRSSYKASLFFKEIR